MNHADFKLVDNRQATPNYKEDKLEQQQDSFKRIFEKMNIDFSNVGLTIELSGSLYAASGIGAPSANGRGGAVANTNDTRPQEREVFTGSQGEARPAPERKAIERDSRWPAEPAVGRVANGIPRRVDRLKCLGNAVVPQIPEVIGRAIMAAEGF